MMEDHLLRWIRILTFRASAGDFAALGRDA
jgi:hypothetical protein